MTSAPGPGSPAGPRAAARPTSLDLLAAGAVLLVALVAWASLALATLGVHSGAASVLRRCPGHRSGRLARARASGGGPQRRARRARRRRGRRCARLPGLLVRRRRQGPRRVRQPRDRHQPHRRRRLHRPGPRDGRAGPDVPGAAHLARCALPGGVGLRRALRADRAAVLPPVAGPPGDRARPRRTSGDARDGAPAGSAERPRDGRAAAPRRGLAAGRPGRPVRRRGRRSAARDVLSAGVAVALPDDRGAGPVAVPRGAAGRRRRAAHRLAPGRRAGRPARRHRLAQPRRTACCSCCSAPVRSPRWSRCAGRTAACCGPPAGCSSSCRTRCASRTTWR